MKAEVEAIRNEVQQAISPTGSVGTPTDDRAHCGAGRLLRPYQPDRNAKPNSALIQRTAASRPTIRASRKNSALKFAVAAEIQIIACGYSAECAVRGCRARATRLARYTDGQDRPLKQRELCE